MTPTPAAWSICTCGHDEDSHIRGTGRCREHDSDGACDCRRFEPDDDTGDGVLEEG